MSERLPAFVQEATHLLEQASESLTDWSIGFSDKSAIDEVRRLILATQVPLAQAHSSWMTALVHMGSVLDEVDDGRVESNMTIYSYLLFFIDHIIEQLSHYKGQAFESSDELNDIYQSLPRKKEVAPKVDEPKKIEATIPVDIFYEELIELLEQLSQGMARLESAPSEGIIEIQRALHTLKGSARLVGFKAIGDFVHEIEDKLDAQNTQQNHQMIAALIHYFKSHEQAILNQYDLHPELNDLHHAPTDLDSEATRSVVDVEEKLKLPLSDVERLGQLAASASIGQSQLHSQVKSLKQGVGMIQQKLANLEDQTRWIHLHAHAVVDNSPKRQQSDHFDPLEMDRYTQLQQHARDIQETQAMIMSFFETVLTESQEVEETLLSQQQLTHSIENKLRHVRMVSFQSIIPRIEQMIQSCCEDLGKEVELKILQSEGELDRSMLEQLTVPFEHLIRNAIDHGIETKQARKQFNKPEYGHITVSMTRKGGHLMLSVQDDGCGIDLEAVRRKAYENNWWTLSREPTDYELLQLICQPGFSTKSIANVYSGRGIGLDVVHAQVKRLGGNLRIHTERNQGTRFDIELPFTAAMNQAFIFKVNQQPMAFMMSHVVGLVRIPLHELDHLYAHQGVVTYMGEDFPLQMLSHHLGYESYTEHTFHKANPPVLLLQSQERRYAVIIDEVIGNQDVLIQSIGPQMQAMSYLSGASVLGDGQIVLILDPIGLFEQLVIHNPHAMDASHSYHILVVDDSVSVRKVTAKMLSRYGFTTTLAKDGVEAIECLQRQTFDFILLDLEMPRMDGFQFLEWLNAQSGIQKPRVIVISSRSLNKYEERAKELGVEHFLAKPYQEQELITRLNEIDGDKDYGT